jgi:hypothetical protein
MTRQKHRRASCDGRGKELSDAAAEQRMPRTEHLHGQVRRGKEVFSSTGFRGTVAPPTV